MFRKILKGKITFRSGLSSGLKDLISKLLEIDPNERLGAKDMGDSISAHSFFSGLNFDFLISHKVVAPYIPGNQNESGIHFSPIVDGRQEFGEISVIDQEVFKGF